jgi:hypothetical protein
MSSEISAASLGYQRVKWMEEPDISDPVTVFITGDVFEA